MTAGIPGYPGGYPTNGGLLEQPAGVIGLNIVMAPGSIEEGLMRISAANRCDPQVVTVSINKEITVPSLVATNHRLQIRVKWGTGAGVGEALFDARQGARVTLPTSVLYVSALYLGTAGPTFSVSAAAAYGSRPGLGESPLTLTDAAVNIVAAATGPAVPLQVAKYASRVAWVSPDDPNSVPPPQCTIQLSGTQNFAAIEQQISTDAGRFRPIVAGMEFARIRNDGQDANFQLVYELCL